MTEQHLFYNPASATLFYWEIEDGEITFAQGGPTDATREEIQAAAKADGAEFHIGPDGH